MAEDQENHFKVPPHPNEITVLDRNLYPLKIIGILITNEKDKADYIILKSQFYGLYFEKQEFMNSFLFFYFNDNSFWMIKYLIERLHLPADCITVINA